MMARFELTFLRFRAVEFMYDELVEAVCSSGPEIGTAISHCPEIAPRKRWPLVGITSGRSSLSASMPGLSSASSELGEVLLGCEIGTANSQLVVPSSQSGMGTACRRWRSAIRSASGIGTATSSGNKLRLSLAGGFFFFGLGPVCNGELGAEDLDRFLVGLVGGTR